jgi:hypothetical protein
MKAQPKKRSVSILPKTVQIIAQRRVQQILRSDDERRIIRLLDVLVEKRRNRSCQS